MYYNLIDCSTMSCMGTTIQARLDQESEKTLKRLIGRLGWSRSRVVREGLRILATCHLPPKAAPRSSDSDRFRSGIATLAPIETFKRLRPLRPVLLDTGVIVAWLDSSESFHDPVRRNLGQLSNPCYHL